ncbi:Regulator of Vps4 activity in the MVB pathway protein [Trifolium repens]|nr:Regulator of Vps4 activity in the MVB pathway protein [Trifolium repens]
MQERHFTSGKMNIHIDSLTSKEKRLASLLHKTRQDAKQLILSKNLDMYGMEEYIVFYLKSRQENFARLKVVNFIDQKNLIRVLENILTFCELIDRRLPSIDQSQRYGELPVLVKVRSHFSCKYGEEYIVNLTKCKPDSCVNKKIMKLLLLPSPTKDKQNKVLIDIAKQRNIKWYPKNKCTPDFVDDDFYFSKINVTCKYY